MAEPYDVRGGSPLAPASGGAPPPLQQFAGTEQGGTSPGGGRGRGEGGGGRGKPWQQEGDWPCPNPSCNNVNFSFRGECNRCNTPRPPGAGGSGRGSVGGGRGRGRSEVGGRGRGPGGPPGLFGPNDWPCPMCGNVNWAKRNKCNICNTNRPGFNESGPREGRAGGYKEFDEAEIEETKRRRKELEEDDGEIYDEFGNLKKKYRKKVDTPNVSQAGRAGWVMDDVKVRDRQKFDKGSNRGEWGSNERSEYDERDDALNGKRPPDERDLRSSEHSRERERERDRDAEAEADRGRGGGWEHGRGSPRGREPSRNDDYGRSRDRDRTRERDFPQERKRERERDRFD